MMDTKVLLAKSITLLYKESQLKTLTDPSNDLIYTVIESIHLPTNMIGTVNSERDILNDLKETISVMCANPPGTVYDHELILQRIRINCRSDTNLYKSIANNLKENESDSKLQQNIIQLRRTISNHFKEIRIGHILYAANETFKQNRESIRDVNTFITGVIAQLEPLQLRDTVQKDPAIISEVDVGDETSLANVFREIRDTENGNGIMRTGWQALNRMLQGGLRRGDFVVVHAQQHKYKTGFNLSLLKQVALYNKPYMFDANRKPLLLRLSFEDPMTNNLQFLYQSLKYAETGQRVDMRAIDEDVMSHYVRMQLQVNGYHIKMYRIKPSDWSYRDICNMIVDFESQGFEVHALFLDYLAKLPTTGCTNTGPTGTALRDMFMRVRDFCAPKRITVVTPHQLSSESKNLTRGAVADENLVKVIAGQGYSSESRQLDQVVDIELYIHLAKEQRDTYLTVGWGKHRLPTIVDDEDKYFALKFPKGMPIPDDINGEDSSFRRIPKVNKDSELFEFKD